MASLKQIDRAVEIVDVYLTKFGARLFPLRKRKKIGDSSCKRPYVDKWQERDFDRDALLDFIRKGHPIGWALGPEDLVVDVDAATVDRPDKKGPESLKRLEASTGFDFSSTVSVESPSGGRHYYFTKPKDVKIQKALPTFPGVEFLSAGGYVVIAGSPHWQGGNYRFAEIADLLEDYSRAEAPKGLIGLISKPEIDSQAGGGQREATPAQLAQLLDQLDPTSYRDYKAWRDLMFACHSATRGSADGFEVFCDWSTRDPQYADKGPEIKQLWGKVKPGAIGLGTLLKAITEAKGSTAAIDFGPVDESKVEAKQSIGIDRVEGRTDNANADRFIDCYSEHLLFVAQWRRWLSWDGKRWHDDQKRGAMQLAKQYAKKLWADFGKLAPKLTTKDSMLQLLTFVKSTNSASGIRNFVALAESDARVACGVDELNTHLTKLNVQNGTLDLESGKLYPHRPEDRLTQIAKVAFDPKATCPKWEETLQIVFSGKVELIRYVQQLLGYSCAGLDCEHILPICWGNGNNGKSTIGNTIKTLLGDYAIAAEQELLLPLMNQHPTIKADLYQRRFVAVAEITEGRYMAESIAKTLTGGDEIKARRMKEDFWGFKATHTLWLSTNHKPRIRGTDEGIWRRIKLIPFEVNLKEKTTVIPGFGDWLIEHEGPGILNWLVAGFRDWRANGFIEPLEVTAATQEYKKGEDSVGTFLDEYCEEDQQAETLASELYQKYSKVYGGKMTQTAFGSELQKRFKKGRPNAGPNRKKVVYFGVKLIDENTPEISAGDLDELF